MIVFIHPTSEDGVWASLENGKVKIHFRHNQDKIIVVFDRDAAASLVNDLFECLSSLLTEAVLSAEEEEYTPF